MRAHSKKRRIFAPVYLTLILLILYMPILIVIIYSFNDARTIGTWAGFTTMWYSRLLSNALMGDALKNSLVLAFWSVALAGIIGTLGAIGMARSHFHLKGTLETLSTLPMMTPEIILGMAYLALFSAIGLPLGMPTMVITHTTFCIPYVFINVKSRLMGMDLAYEEAARDLGARPLRVLWDITIPMLMPSVLSGMLLAFAMSMDDVVITFFVAGATTTTLPLKVYTGLKSGGTPEINALCTLMLGAVFIIVASAQLLSARSQRRSQPPTRAD